MGQAKRRKQQLGPLYGTPAGRNAQPRVKEPKPVALSADLLKTFLSRDDQIEVANLLTKGPADWERRYSPVQAFAATTSAVIVRCAGEVAVVELVPLVDQHPCAD